MSLRTIGERVVVKRDAKKEKSEGGILIPDEAQPRAASGIVMSVGEGRITEMGVRIPPEVRVGERVFFTRNAGADVVAEDGESLIIRESDILAAIEA